MNFESVRKTFILNGKSMDQRFFDTIQLALSPERLSVYGQDRPGPCVVLARYLWNAALCESLYTPLQMCEVALRNSIHNTMRSLYNDTWYDQVTLKNLGHTKIIEAKMKITRTGKPVIPSRIIAELQFGFWTGMFEGPFEQNTPSLLKGIRDIFPQLSNRLRNPKFIKSRLDTIRHLRNRVFHHERIVHWKDLPEQHGRLIETIGWISPELCEMALKLDRFLETYTHGVGPWIASVRNHWPVKPLIQSTDTASTDPTTANTP